MKKLIFPVLALIFTTFSASAFTVSGFLNYFEHLNGVEHITDKSTTDKLSKDLNMKIRGQNTYALVDADSAMVAEVRSKLLDISDEKYLPVINQNDKNGDCITRIFIDRDHKKTTKRLMLVIFNANDIIVSFVRGILPKQVKR